MTSAANIASMDSLENALNAQYQTEINNAETFQRSKDFGRTVAERIFTWSTTDGSDHANDPYTPNGGLRDHGQIRHLIQQLWQNLIGVITGRFVQAVATGTASPLPPPYSTDPNSAYYAMVKEVYDVSQTLDT